MTQEERYKLFRQIMWDYNISPEEVDAVLLGKAQKAGHYTLQALLVKLLESYSWFTIVQLFPGEELRDLITDDVVKKIKSKALQTKYEFVQKRLQQITIDKSKTIVSEDFAQFFIEEDNLFLKQ